MEEQIMTAVDKPTASLLEVVSLALVTWFSIALFFFLVAWVVGGEPFYHEGLVGSYTFPVVVAGFVIGLIGHVVGRRKS
jgi:fumarate reductase subunit C